MSKPIPAASVVLARAPGSAELLLVQRAENLRFFGGFCAFPGGKVGPTDADLAGRAGGVSPLLLTPQHVAAVRELFEETGILLARRRDGSLPPADPGWAELRRDLLADRLPFADLLARLDLSLHAGDLKPVGTLVTPAFSPMRFDTAFFLGVLPPGQEVDVWPGELTHGIWATPADILDRWQAGEWLISPPTISLLMSIQHAAAVEHLPLGARALFDHLETGALPAIWFSPGILMIPLEVRGLPPATHTNTYLVGTGSRYLIDPAPTDPAEQDRMFAVIDRETAEGLHLAGILLTHHHPDHVGAAVRAAQVYGAPILAHPLTARLLQGKVAIDRELHDGETLDLGPAPHGRGRWALQALHTPGHAPGHLVLWEESYRLLFASDMVSTISSIIIAPPEGDLAQYLDSLRLLLRLPARLLLPAHGPPSARPRFVIEEAIAHRATRENQLIAALQSGPRSIADLLPELYRGLPANLMRLAELQTLAGLQKLQREGRAEETGEGKWQMRPEGPA